MTAAPQVTGQGPIFLSRTTDPSACALHKKSPPVLRRASFHLTYKIELSQDSPHIDRPMVMMVMPGGGDR